MIELFKREYLLAIRYINDVLQSIFFLIVMIAIFPIAVGTNELLLKKIAPGIVWVAVILSIFLSGERIYKNDFEDGTLEQLYLSGNNNYTSVIVKLISQWINNILPILLILPILGLWYSISIDIIFQIALTLLIGSPSLLLLSMLGSAITLSVNRSGMLLVLIVLPSYLPILIFALSSINAFSEGFSNIGQISILAAILSLMITIIPFAITTTIKVYLSEY